jgi:lipopolysaccharide transport system ATP-binding protein
LPTTSAVLTVGDFEFPKKCLGKMSEAAGEGRTVLFVSHNMASVASLCGSAMLLAAAAVGIGPTNQAIQASTNSPTGGQGAEFSARREKPSITVRMAISSAIVPLHVATTGPMASLARRRRASSQ